MRVSVVTPDATFFDGEATSITLEASNGSLGILPGHAPFIAALGHGVAEVKAKDGTSQVAVYGGFVKVQDDVVSVLAGGAAKKDGDAETARAALSNAEQELQAAKDGGDAAALPELEERVRRARAFLGLF